MNRGQALTPDVWPDVRPCHATRHLQFLARVLVPKATSATAPANAPIKVRQADSAASTASSLPSGVTTSTSVSYRLFRLFDACRWVPPSPVLDGVRRATFPVRRLLRIAGGGGELECAHGNG